MKKLNFAVLAMTLVAIFSLASYGQRAARIKFARGATSAVASGNLNSYRGTKSFVIRVRAGQTLRTSQIRSAANPVTVYIKDPSGEDVGDSDASCNNRREISPTTAGDYRIEVVECRKADPWRGSFRIRVTVR